MILVVANIYVVIFSILAAILIGNPKTVFLRAAAIALPNLVLVNGVLSL